jgi:hypothetical protein
MRLPGFDGQAGWVLPGWVLHRLFRPAPAVRWSRPAAWCVKMALRDSQLGLQVVMAISVASSAVLLAAALAVRLWARMSRPM